MAAKEAGRGRPYGLHRVLEPAGLFPQQAWRIDNTPVLYDNEIRIRCEALYLEAASFAWFRQQYGDDPGAIGRALMELVERRGKVHNPETDTGGVAIGKVDAIGSACTRHRHLQVGQEVGCLTSLTQIPLHLERVKQVDFVKGLIWVEGTAIAPDLGVVVPPPADLPPDLQLRMFEVAGIGPHVASLVEPGMKVAILGAGTPTGLFAAYAALEAAGEGGLVVAVEAPEGADRRRLAKAEADMGKVFDIPLDQSVALYEMAEEVTGGELFDVTVHCADAPGTELAAVAITRPKGTVVFFSMATRFAAAAIAGEAFAREQELLIGKGYLEGHVEASAGLVRRHPRLRAALER